MFVHLHCHYSGSYSDSVLRIPAAVEKVRRRGQKALALTDHGEIPCARLFQQECRRSGVKPLFGAEIYFVENARETIEKNDRERFHLVLLAKNPAGLKNLFCLLSDAWTVNSFEEKRGLVDWALLEKYREGLVVLSGCFYSLIGQTFYRQGKEAAAKILSRYRSIFGDDFFVEVARHGVKEEDRIVAGLIKVAGWQGITPVLTNDAHYLDPEDWNAHEVLMRTRYDHVIDFHAHSHEYWLKSEEEMRLLGFPEAYLEQTAAVADRCEPLTLPRIEERKNIFMSDLSNPESLISSGRAAYLAKMNFIDGPTALRHVRETLGAGEPDEENVARRIVGLPRSSEPDTEHIVYAFGKPLKEFVPLKRAAGKIMTQWDKEACEQAGAIVLARCPVPLLGTR